MKKSILLTCLSFLVSIVCGYEFPQIEKLENPQEDEIFYFKFSHPDHSKIPAKCSDPSAAICLIKSGKTIANAGKISTLSYVQESQDHHSLTFDQGQKCESGFGNFSTRFDIFCPHPGEEIGIPIIKAPTTNKCSFNFFVWHRGSNCKSEKSLGCSIEIPEFEQKIDLKNLAAENYYEVDGKYQVNICQKVKNSKICQNSSFVCDLTEKKEFISDPFAVKSVKYLEKDEKVSLTYSKLGQIAEFLIQCDKKEDFKINLEEKNSQNLTFSIKTKKMCLTKPSQCTWTSQKHNYDLTNLRSKPEPRQVFHTLDKNREFFVSLCKPLAPGFDQCPGDKTSICLVNSKTRESFAIAGQIQDNLTQETENSFVLGFESGSACNGKFNYTSQIVFVCDEQDNLQLLDILDNCTHIFQWKTPEACAKVDYKSKGCIVKDDFFGHVFNVTELHQNDQDFHIEDIDLNVCGGLIHSKCGPEAVLCHNDKLIGTKKSEKIEFTVTGQIELTYSGQKCNDRRNFSSLIFLHCDQKIGLGQPNLIWHEDCDYNFMWSTTLACPPFDEVDCFTRDENMELFDFSPLTLNNDTYEVPLENGLAVMNLCRSLVHTSVHGECPYKSGICWIHDGNGSLAHTNLGQVNRGPYLDEHNRLVVDYDNGAVCKEPGTSETHISSKIIFYCRMDRKDTKPTFLRKEGCKYIFWWDHHLACPQHSHHLITQDSCMVTDDKTGTLYDLRQLKNNQSFETKDQNGVEYIVTVCGSFNKTLRAKCGVFSAACLKDDKGNYQSLGEVNDRLMIQDSSPILHYDTESTHSSITFQCDETDQNGKLELVDKVKNHYYFSLNTILACPHSVHCEVDNVDLSNLKNFDQDIFVKNDTKETYFSICKPLKVSRGCLPGSAICQKDQESWISYGVPFKPPEKTLSGISLAYHQGSNCQADQKYSSEIIFKCDEKIFPGKPVKAESLGCHAKFFWPTSAACQIDNAWSTNDCLIEDQPIKPWLKYLQSRKEISVEKNGKTFYLNTCGQSSKCQGTICLKNQKGQMFNLGDTKSAEFSNTQMRVKYKSSEKCNNFTSFGAEIRFICDIESKREPHVYLAYDLPCYPIFVWKTYKTCGVDIKKHHSENWLAKIWPLVLFLAFGLGLIYLLKDPWRREKTLNFLTNFKTKLCQRRQQEDHNILIENNVTIPTLGALEVMDEDDDLILA